MARSTSQKPWQAPDRSGEHANSSADEGAARAGLQAISLLAGPAGSLDGDVDVLTMGAAGAAAAAAAGDREEFLHRTILILLGIFLHKVRSGGDWWKSLSAKITHIYL